jgi:phage-related protein
VATDIGNVYLDVYADTDALKRQIRAAAKQAGKNFGKEFGGEAEKSLNQTLSRLGKQTAVKMGNAGKVSGREFGRQWNDSVRGMDEILVDKIREAGTTGDWDVVFSQFASLDEAIDRTNARLKELGKGGQFAKQTGVSITELRKQMEAAAAETRRMGEETRVASEEEKKRAELIQRLATAMKAQEQAQIANSQALKEALTRQAAQDTQRLRNEHDNLQRALAKSTSEMNAFNASGRGTDENAVKIRRLNTEYEALQNRLRKVVQEHNVMTAGMDKNSEQYVAAVAKQRAALAGLDDQLRALNKRKITLKVNVDTPSAGKVAAEGNLLGRIFGKAFQSGAKKIGASGNPFAAMFDKVGNGVDFVGRKWKELAVAMPAGLQFILANFLLLIGPISTVGSALGSVLIPLVGALGVAIGGLTAAIAGFGAAAGYAIALAVKSFDVFKEKFPETEAAIQNLKDAFNKVDVPAFAAEWSESLKNFSNTLADSLRFDEVAANLGKATATITDSFTAVLKSPAWTGFVSAIEGPLSSSLAGIGTGLAGVFGVALQWMTAAAPLAQTLGEQFAIWGTNLNAALATTDGQAGLTSFMTIAANTIGALVPLVSNLAQAFNNIFLAGAETGAGFLSTLAGLAEQFNAWTESVGGMESLNVLFAQGQQVFNALLPLVGALGAAFATMVTPESVAGLTVLMSALTQILPIFAELVAQVSNVGAFEILGALLQTIGQAITPLVPVIGVLASVLGDALFSVIQALVPVLATLAQALVPVIAAFSQIVLALGPAIASVIGALGPVFAALGPVITEVFKAIDPLIPVFAELITMIAGAVAQVLPALMPLFAALGPVINVVLQALMPLIPIFTSLITIVANLVTAILPPLMPIFAAIGDLFTALAPIIQELGGKIADLLVNAVTTLAPVLAGLMPVVLALIEAFMPFVDIVFDLANAIITSLQPILMPLLDIFTSLAPTIIQLVIAFVPILRVIQLLAPLITLLLPPVASLIGLLLTLIQPVLDLIEPFLTFIVQLVSGKKAIGDILGFFQKMGLVLIEAGAAVAKWLKGIVEGFSKFASKFGNFFTNIFVKFDDFVAKILGFGEKIVSGLLTGLASAWNGVVLWFTNVIESIIDLVKGLFGIHSPSSVFMDFGKMILQGLIDGLTTMLAAIGTFFVSLFTTIGTLVVDGITAYITFWLELPGKVISAIATLAPMVGEWIANVFTTIADFTVDAVVAYVTFWLELPGKIIDAVSTLIDLAGTWISDVWAKIVEIGTTAWTTYITFWTDLPGKIIGFVTPLIAKVGTWIGEVFAKLKSAAEMGWTNTVGFFTGLPDKVITAVGTLLEKIKTFGSNVMDSLKAGFEQGWTAVSTWVGGIGDKIKSLAGDGLTLLKTAGKNIIDSLLGGMKESWKKVTDFVGGIGTWIKDNKGPKAYDLQLLTPAGGWIMEGLQKGIRDAMPDLRRTLSGVSNAIQVGAGGSIGVNAARGGGNMGAPVGAAGGGTTVASGAIQIITPVKDPYIAASIVLDGLVALAQ